MIRASILPSIALVFFASAASAEYRIPVEELAGKIRSNAAMQKAIRADCKFRHPDSLDVRLACSSRQASLYKGIAEHWFRADHAAKAIILYCMDNNRSLNGFDWQDVSWCYERMIVENR